jgi:hypothetical protein
VFIMHRVSRHSSVVVALAMALMACGEGAAGQARQVAAAGKPACPMLAQVQTVIGFPVKSHPVPVDGCLYELTGDYAGVMIQLMYQPAARAEAIYGDIRQHVKAKGPDAGPDKLSVGEGGWGYASRGHKEAAAVSRGRVYHLEIEHDLFESLAFPADVAVKLIELGMRVAPGPGASGTTASSTGAASTPLDACTPATNAEFAQAVEERPERAQHWSAPVASLGGSHCDYDGGSIRVYQGKNAAANFAATFKAFGADKAPRTPVPGIGDKAYFVIPYTDDPYQRLGLLAVHAGPRVVQFILDARGQEPIEATRPRLEKLARLVVPRLP